MKVVTIVGARPQFIKAAPLTKALQEAGCQEYLVHTGQHYDYGMSQVFFDELGLPEPNINLEVGSGPHGRQTGQMLAGIEKILLTEKPDWALVYGDTNSTIAAALAAVKLHIPLAHVEAGLRSYNREMPEEHNRVLTDHCADMLFCPTQVAVDNLAKEGITKNVHLVGDTMYDAILQFGEIACKRSTILKDWGLLPKKYLLATVHRQANTDDPEKLRNILSAFAQIEEPVIFLVHPRTRQKFLEFGMDTTQPKYQHLELVEPAGYLDMLMLEQSARAILTDSGGIQKEAYWFGVPCITLREETEWVETVQAGWNILTGTEADRVIRALNSFINLPAEYPKLYGDGHSARRIVEIMRG
jgi:UDP-N-acetylglucosamine 2-epimerase